MRCVFPPHRYIHVIKQVAKTDGIQPKTRQAVRVAEAPPYTCSGEIKLKRFSHEYSDIIMVMI